MAPVIPTTRQSALARREIPLHIPRGDSDLLPIAVFLWIFSAARVISTLAHRQTFDAEATLALSWVLALPLYILRARRTRNTAEQ